MLLTGHTDDSLRDIARLNMLRGLDIIGNLLPDAIEDDMARDILIDIAGYIDEVQIRLAFLGKENRLIDSFAAIDGTINRH